MAAQSDYTQLLKTLMKRAEIHSYRVLATLAGVSRWQVQQLRAGNVETMRVSVLMRFAEVLQVDLPDLLSQFGVDVWRRDGGEDNSPAQASIQTDAQQIEAQQVEAQQVKALQLEYQRLQQQSAQQLEAARSQFQSESLRALETWLVQWPTIAKRAQQRGADLPTEKILPFVRPVESLVAAWGVEAIAPVDSQVPYDPQYHQLVGATAALGELVTVTHSGAMHHGKLLHRAKVK